MLEKITDSLFIRKQKKILSRELERLEAQYKTTKKFPEYGTSEDENVQELEKFQENLSLQKNLKNLIHDARKALAKIDRGTYGKCETCKSEIEQGRLKAYPSADMCVTCINKRYRRR